MIMHHEDELTTVKTEEDEYHTHTTPASGQDTPSTNPNPSPSSDDDDLGDRILVSLGPEDPRSPYNWSEARKRYVVLVGTMLSINSTMGSSITSNMIPALQAAFGVPDGSQTILPASIFLVGFVLGPLVFAPLSEQHGRKPILVSTLFLYMLSTMAAALSPTWACFIVFRLLGGVFAAPPMSVTGGSIADVYGEKVARGRANMLWSAATLLGPLAGPVIAGFTSKYAWQWSFWAAMMLSGITLVMLLIQPETLTSRILRDMAARLNKEKKCHYYIAPADQNRLSVLATLKITTTRPLALLFTELIVALTSIYMAFVYAVFYMLLEIFPSIFEGIYGFSAGMSGLAFVMMFAGSMIANGFGFWYDKVAQKMVAKHPTKQPEYLRLPLACTGGPAFVVALLWLGWASKTSVHWIVPLLAIIPYGFGYQMIFMAMINYIADAYGIYASSALAACAAARSVAGAVIPLAIDSMLNNLGVAWSCTVLALISCVLCLVPFGFIIWGEKIRAGSDFSSKLHHQEPNLELVRSMSLV